ncbi:MAG: hypothetical protein D6725_07230 [Planctomycetota bacterium]|nr:MAG: hypothetical protein D6725_07230 [Planctomycetota bacterium]
MLHSNRPPAAAVPATFDGRRRPTRFPDVRPTNEPLEASAPARHPIRRGRPAPREPPANDGPRACPPSFFHRGAVEMNTRRSTHQQRPPRCSKDGTATTSKFPSQRFASTSDTGDSPFGSLPLWLAATAALCLLAPSFGRADVLIVLKDGKRIRADTIDVDEAAGTLSARSERHGVVMVRRLAPQDIAVVMRDAEVVYSAARRHGVSNGTAPRADAAPDPTANSRAVVASSAGMPSVGGPSHSARSVAARCSPNDRTASARKPVHKTTQDAHRRADGVRSIERESVGWQSRRRLVAPGLPSRSIVVGTRGDPLDAYDDLLRIYYPAGVPPRERGIALQTLRNVRLNQMLADSLGRAGFGLPLLPSPQAFLPGSASRDGGGPRSATPISRNPRISIFYPYRRLTPQPAPTQ